MIRAAGAALAALALAGCTGASDDAPVFTPSSLPYPFSSAVAVDDILYLSGEIGVLEDGRTLAPGGIEPETRQMFKRIGKTLAARIRADNKRFKDDQAFRNASGQ